MSPAQPRPAADAEETSVPRRPKALVAVLSLAGIVVSLTQTLVIPIVPELPLWGWFALRAAQPLVDLRTTARRQVLFTNFASAVGFAMFGTSLVLPQLLQLPRATGYGLGKSLLVAGLVLAPQGLMMMATAPVSAVISKRRGPKVTLMLGALIVSAGSPATSARSSETAGRS